MSFSEIYFHKKEVKFRHAAFFKHLLLVEKTFSSRDQITFDEYLTYLPRLQGSLSRLHFAHNDLFGECLNFDYDVLEKEDIKNFHEEAHVMLHFVRDFKYNCDSLQEYLSTLKLKILPYLRLFETYCQKCYMLEPKNDFINAFEIMSTSSLFDIPFTKNENDTSNLVEAIDNLENCFIHELFHSELEDFAVVTFQDSTFSLREVYSIENLILPEKVLAFTKSGNEYFTTHPCYDLIMSNDCTNVNFSTCLYSIIKFVPYAIVHSLNYVTQPLPIVNVFQKLIQFCFVYDRGKC